MFDEGGNLPLYRQVIVVEQDPVLVKRNGVNGRASSLDYHKRQRSTFATT